ncbi:hypothetical protein KAFR_0E03520 [Kazachstania africana CBS 2517]|uniref:Dit2p n=1 Tax=Kazachstania africana (strain ATCC 22294 / BCRC 22015 / CBS 2517 / CECT 1963 / NBRC 1671 / NRRL Y-8276) TaxID=1071382 RepID=H2AVV3_KAZAF|nr:hypothetical protein KAFR_0E03520 [Kazachstania africana CBS 2517]CCF58503.1 hypothetical protein KAFR_0E03520 [Kazachstania africana CBS 2517]
MAFYLGLGLSSLLFVAIFLFKVIIPPFNFPRNIPTIPFYVIFLPSFFNIDQTELYNNYLKKPLERYGAVNIFFGSRWNILVSKPEYLAQIFRDENTFAKSGNQKKIPYSILAAYTGENIISAHGDAWRTYRRVMTNGLQFFNEKPFVENIQLLCDIIEEKNQKTQKQAIKVSPLIQRLALDNISQVLLSFDFGTLKNDLNPLHRHLIRIKKQIFDPFFLTFPFLDQLPIPKRKRGFEDVKKFREILVTTVRKQLVDNYKFEQIQSVSSDLIRAHNNEVINYKQLSDNIVILLVAGHENPQLAITTALYLLAKYEQTWQMRIIDEIKHINVEDIKELATLPCLNSFIFEAIRFYPPLNTIINRCTSRKCQLGTDIVIPKGTYVGYNNFGNSHNVASWGITADSFEPERWGNDIETIMKNWKIAKNNCTLSSFHGGRRACLGEKLALVELRITIAGLLQRFHITLGSEWDEKMTPAGPLCPLDLQLNFEPRKDRKIN